MATPFPAGNPFLSGNHAPITMECDAPDLPVIGELPPGLAGTLYRNGPNPQFTPLDPKHYNWFAGDGMLHAFHIESGRVRYRNRWIRTPRWEMEHEVGHALFGGLGGGGLPEVQGRDSGVANTNVVVHGGRLLALEEAHRPFEVDPTTLEPRGYHAFGANGQGPVTAHPKTDPKTGELVFFGYNAAGPFTPMVSYGVADKAGNLTRRDRFEAPFPAMVHDFIVTDRHVLFPILPLTGSMERAKSGRPAYAWEPDKGAHVGVMRRDAAVSTMRWFDAPASYVFHVLNAWDEGDKVIAYVMRFDVPPGFTRPDGSRDEQARKGARLHRWTFDLAGTAKGFVEEEVDDLSGEFPRIDDRFAGLSTRHGFAAVRTGQPVANGGFDTIAHFDLVSGSRRLFALPAGDGTGEPVFVPRGAAAGEGDGWLLATVWRAAENRSDLLVLDTSDITAGPVASVPLSHRIPFGFHGNFVAAL